ncbi:hypothetical protein, partial [Klebsiella quasipneumoniae]|uniref:hypothetical protein n=1 Tax=Klebsiella quasipneumoniae TaxID=1463165 RepID=UPI003D36FD72
NKFVQASGVIEQHRGRRAPKWRIKGHVFCSKKGVRPNEGLSEWPQLFTISYFKELDSADWLCEGIDRGSKPRFTE